MGQAVSDQGRRHYKCRKGDDLTSTAGGHDVSVAHLLNPGYNRTMKMPLAIITLLACPSLVMAGNFAECLLDKLPGVQNDATAYAAAQLCTSKYPERYDSIEQGSGRGLFSYESGAECALDKGADTLSSSAAGQIRVACNRLYNKQCSNLASEFGLNCQSN